MPWERVSGNCAECGTWRVSLHRDHIIPKFLGGGNEPENIQHLCANCHQDKTLLEHQHPVWLANLRAGARSRVENGRHQGHPRSPETRAKIAASLRGRTLSAEHRANVTAGVRKYHKQRKETT